MDSISMLGYSDKSPYKHNPYLDIVAPDGRITMADTSIDLIGMDNTGMVKKMKAGRKEPYQFKGDIVREVPINNPYQKGGFTQNQLFNFLFDDDDVSSNPEPAQDKKEVDKDLSHLKNEKMLAAKEQEELALEQASMAGNPYRRDNAVPIQQSGNPFRANHADFYDEAQKYKGLPYKFAGTGEGGIDCSGYVCKVVGLPRTTSEEIVKNAPNFRQFTGNTGELKEGTVIGFDTGHKSFDAGRKYGMDHVGVVVKNPYTGNLEYTHSAGSTGVATMSIDKMLSKYKNAKIYLGDYGTKK